jgi:predicted DNA-binding transcriptional regulator YafY
MRRACLFQIVQHLGARRLTTAQQLASWLEVSHRTIYRDIQDFSLSGVPVEGEAGTGYRMSREFEVRPIMFTFDEVEALVTGLRMVESWGGPALAAASRAALAKVTLALPVARREEVEPGVSGISLKVLRFDKDRASPHDPAQIRAWRYISSPRPSRRGRSVCSGGRGNVRRT